jgi:hypothetical protein
MTEKNHWFSKPEQELITTAVCMIAERLNMEEEDLLKPLNLSYEHPLDAFLKKHSTHDPVCCHALFENGTQCSRKLKPNEQFCKIHAKMRSAGTLRDENVAKFDVDRAIERYRSLRKDSRFFRLQLIVREDQDYLVDSITGYVYDFETLKQIGKMHASGKIFLNHESLNF